MRIEKMLAMAVAFGLSASAFGAATVLVTETFDDDPSARGWGGVNNVSADPDGAGPLIPNNVTWFNTDNTGSAVNPAWGTATGAGEIGADQMNRFPNMFYGVDLGGAVDFATTDMSVSGVLHQVNPKGSSTLNIGWSQGINSVNTGSGSALYVSWDDGVNGAAPGLIARSASGGGIASAATANMVAGVTVPFSYVWDAVGDGTGVFSFTLGANPTTTLALTDGEVAQLPPLTHWGIWGRTDSSPDDAGNRIFFDDIQYTAVPEPASLSLLAMGVLAGLRRRRA
jgi:hypothetical protein